MADRLLNNEVDTINVGNVDNDIRDSYTRSMIAELEPSSVASKHHLENTFFIQDSDRYLYKCLQEINIGDTITVGVNVARYDISEALYELYAQGGDVIRDVISNVETGSTASRNFAQGECILWTDGNLYEVSTSVTLGTTWTVGTNISLVPNVTDYIKSLADTTYNTGDSAETNIADGDYFPFYDTSATNKKKTLWSNIVTKLKEIFLVSTIESSLQAASMGSTAGRQYAVGLDSDGKMSVNVPWEDHNTTYSVTSKTAAGLAPQLPNETTTTKYLRQDGTWQVPPDTNTWRGIQDNLSSDSAVDSLSAKQGKALNTGKAPTSHNSTGTGYGVGNASYYGHVKLSDTYTSNVGAAANAIGASQNAVYNVWNTLGAATNWTDLSNKKALSGMYVTTAAYVKRGKLVYICIDITTPSSQVSGQDGWTDIFTNLPFTFLGTQYYFGWMSSDAYVYGQPDGAQRDFACLSNKIVVSLFKQYDLSKRIRCSFVAIIE